LKLGELEDWAPAREKLLAICEADLVVLLHFGDFFRVRFVAPSKALIRNRCRARKKSEESADATFRNQACYRSVVHDHAAAGLQHLLNFIFHCEKHALHIDGERLIER
jgi:hypothetical protein